MKIAFFTAVFLLLLPDRVCAQTGEELFKTACSSCHTIKGGRLIGPDLTGIYDLRENAWLVSFIRSSQKMIKAGDPDAVAIFTEYNRIPMPDNNMTDAQINSIIDYIRETDNAAPVTAEKAEAPGDSVSLTSDSTLAEGDTSPVVALPDDTLMVTDEQLDAGRSYYYGITPFTNGAAPCYTCHNINDGSFLGGGRLSLDLTVSYAKLGMAGINAIMKNPPFPAMRASIPGELTDEEINSLNTLLKTVSERSPHTFPTPGGMIFFVLGFVGAVFVAALTILLYDDREIPDRNPLT
jgi:cytochrome c2